MTTYDRLELSARAAFTLVNTIVNLLVSYLGACIVTATRLLQVKPSDIHLSPLRSSCFYRNTLKRRRTKTHFHPYKTSVHSSDFKSFLHQLQADLEESKRNLEQWPELVGIESNPGPKGGAKKMLKKKATNSPAKALAIKGRGDYKTIGGRIGGWVGDKAQKFIEGIMGMGDYKVKGNTLINPNNQVPQFETGKGWIRIRHREYFGDLLSSQSFNCRDFALDPTNSAMFPWLSGVVQNYQKYKFVGLVAEYKTMSGMVATSSTTGAGQGTVIIATRYDADSPTFVSKIQMEEYEFTQSTVPWESVIHPIECSPDEDVVDYYFIASPGTVNASGQSANSSRFTRKGITSVATTGFPNSTASVCGELWVSYDIILREPRLPTATFAAYYRSTYQGGANFCDVRYPFAVVSVGGTANSGQAFSSNSLLITSIPVTVSPTILGNNSTNILLWPQGYSGLWVISWLVQASGNNFTANTPVFTGGCSAATATPALFQNSSGPGNFSVVTVSGVQTATCFFNATNAAGTIQIQFNTSPANYTYLDLYITPASGIPQVTNV